MVSLLSFPVPPGLMEFLFSRGLGIWVLPEGDRAQEIAYKHLRIEPKVLDGVNRYPHEHPHYDVRSKSIIVPVWRLYNSEHNVLVHEIGHAVDFLYTDKGRVSDLRPFYQLLGGIAPLDSHCERQDGLYGGRGEQFATAFEAFLSEPVEKSSEFLHNIDEISPGLIKAFQKHMVDPFRKQNEQQEARG